MQTTEVDDDDLELRLVKASSTLIEELRNSLPKLLRNPTNSKSRGRVHSKVRRRELDLVVKLIEPFQSDPQLLDAWLKHILPPIVDAYIEYLDRLPGVSCDQCLDLETGICVLLYNLCKVRGYKIVVGFLNNEPRYLEPILERLESALQKPNDQSVEWQASYVLLLWLSHLCLAPFGLASISDQAPGKDDADDDVFGAREDLPLLAKRLLRVGFRYLPTSTKAQDAAAMLLVRLVARPDMQTLKLADDVVTMALSKLKDEATDTSVTVYSRLGPLRLLAGVAASAELSHLIPGIHRSCSALADAPDSAISSNAVAKRLLLKILRNITTICLHMSSASGPLISFLQTSTPLEDTVDLCLRSLADRSTPVRHAAAKALSHLVLNLETAMGHEVVQAVLDTLKEDMPEAKDDRPMDFRTVNPSLWHGLTLTLAHMLFKQSASPDQLGDIVDSLVAALQFEQRAATGNSIGANVRDAGNFGIWALSRRYTTDELLVIGTRSISERTEAPVIQWMSGHLMTAACFDPEGNVRRGSSAALQELVGRHPNQIVEGIALVQVVDYQAVALRRRAMIEVANRSATLFDQYWLVLSKGLYGWRGLASPEVASREAAAASLAGLGSRTRSSEQRARNSVSIMDGLHNVSPHCPEEIHGLAMALTLRCESDEPNPSEHFVGHEFQDVLKLFVEASKEFSTRSLRSDLPAAIAQATAAVCKILLAEGPQPRGRIPFSIVNDIIVRLMARPEESVRQHIPVLCHTALQASRAQKLEIYCLNLPDLCKNVATNASKGGTVQAGGLQGAGSAIALGALAPLYGEGLEGEQAAEAVGTVAALIEARNVDWRILGMQALRLAVGGEVRGLGVEGGIAETIIDAVHRGMNDYTIDQRGDVGSLVRLQAISCTEAILARDSFRQDARLLHILQADIYRLSVEKLDRVRLAAAHCRQRYIDTIVPPTDVASASSYLFFLSAFCPLADPAEPEWKHRALLAGSTSSAGAGGESLLQASRLALTHVLAKVPDAHLATLLSHLSAHLKVIIASASAAVLPTLSLLAYLLDTRIPYRLAVSHSSFSWLTLLSLVQQSHHRSPDIPKILTALQVYRGLAEVPAIRCEVLKKLAGMLGGNPYPVVRGAVAEMVWVVCAESGELEGLEALKAGDREGGKAIGERIKALAGVEVA